MTKKEEPRFEMNTILFYSVYFNDIHSFIHITYALFLFPTGAKATSTFSFINNYNNYAFNF